jgi:hypothetical protein
MTALVLDAGALEAIDRADREVAAMLRVAWERGVPVRTSSAVVAQVWRDGARQALLSRVLTGVRCDTLDAVAARDVGRLLGRSRTADVVDAHVAGLTPSGAVVLTSDPGDIEHLLEVRGVAARVVRV